MAKIKIKSEKLTPFGGIFSGRGAIRPHIIICNRLAPQSKVLIIPFHGTYLR